MAELASEAIGSLSERSRRSASEERPRQDGTPPRTGAGCVSRPPRCRTRFLPTAVRRAVACARAARETKRAERGRARAWGERGGGGRFYFLVRRRAPVCDDEADGAAEPRRPTTDERGGHTQRGCSMSHSCAITRRVCVLVLAPGVTPAVEGARSAEAAMQAAEGRAPSVGQRAKQRATTTAVSSLFNHGLREQRRKSWLF